MASAIGDCALAATIATVGAYYACFSPVCLPWCENRPRTSEMDFAEGQQFPQLMVERSREQLATAPHTAP